MTNRKSVLGVALMVACLLCLPCASGKTVEDKSDSVILKPFETYNVTTTEIYRGYEMAWKWNSTSSLDLLLVHMSGEVDFKIGNQTTDSNLIVVPNSGNWTFSWKNWDNSSKSLTYSITVDDKAFDYIGAATDVGILGLIIAVILVVIWYCHKRR